MSEEFRHLTIPINDLLFHVVEIGPEKGKPVIFLHGFPEFWWCWHQQAEKMAAEGYRVWLPDQRGYNLTDKPKGKAAYRIDRLAADVVGLIDAMGEEKVILAAHDWGAAVAWWVAGTSPERLESLIIVNVPHPSVMARTVRKNIRQMMKSWYMFFFQLPVIPEFLLKRYNFRALTSTLVGSSHRGTFSNEELDLYRVSWRQPGALTGMINWYRALFQLTPPSMSHTTITVPTLLIWGVGDRFLGREMAEPSIKRCQDGQLVFIETGTHWVHHEEPVLVNDAIMKFLEKDTFSAE